jgi:hypothetical protein
MGWFVLNKYYAMSEDVPAYSAALLLHPSKRVAYLKQNWPEEWHDNSISAARNIWKAEYNSIAQTPPLDILTTLPTSASEKQKENKLDQLLKSIRVANIAKPQAIADLDNFDTFISAPPIEIDCTPLQWWCQPQQRQQYPHLSRMAIDILSIPAESVEPERTFSGARRTASWDRLRLSCANIERVECIGNWLREGLIVPSYRSGMGLVCIPGEDLDAMNADTEVLDDFDSP